MNKNYNAAIARLWPPWAQTLPPPQPLRIITSSHSSITTPPPYQLPMSITHNNHSNILQPTFIIIDMLQRHNLLLLQLRHLLPLMHSRSNINKRIFLRNLVLSLSRHLRIICHLHSRINSRSNSRSSSRSSIISSRNSITSSRNIIHNHQFQHLLLLMELRRIWELRPCLCLHLCQIRHWSMLVRKMLLRGNTSIWIRVCEIVWTRLCEMMMMMSWFCMMLLVAMRLTLCLCGAYVAFLGERKRYKRVKLRCKI
mmetsp:Transcript_29610/g.43044  ORF Transcript_29610/g.43044 Transcript_29610/m.43044 type:complete len:254 (+) Transcript_29610:884-1645(+)